MTLEQTLRQIKRVRFWRERGIIFLLTSSLFLNLVNWLYLLFSLKGRAKIIPLHSGLLFGIDRIGSKFFLFKIPSIGLCIFVLNFILAFFFYEKGKVVAAQIFLASLFFLQIILLLSTILTINL